jgi:hypothetical protein
LRSIFSGQSIVNWNGFIRLSYKLKLDAAAGMALFRVCTLFSAFFKNSGSKKFFTLERIWKRNLIDTV